MNGPGDEHRRCLICGQECRLMLAGLFDDRFGAPGPYDIVRCGHCGLEQTWPQHPERELKELYERFYNWGGERGTAYSELRERFLGSGLYRLWLKWDGDISFHLPQGTGRLLDVGCNEGRGLVFYSQNGFQAEGLEINERAAAIARQRGFTVHTVPLAQFTPEKPYGVVVLSNVLEHAVDPVAMLREVRRLLNPGGHVWISCPNGASFWRRIFGRRWINWHVPFHQWHFTIETLRKILERADLRLTTWQTCTPALWVAQSLCAWDSKMGRANRLMRSAPVIAGSMLLIRSLGFPLLRRYDRQMAGDCLIITAAPEL
jgi:SAM-dependent methyltransferase